MYVIHSIGHVILGTWGGGPDIGGVQEDKVVLRGRSLATRGGGGGDMGFLKVQQVLKCVQSTPIM